MAPAALATSMLKGLGLGGDIDLVPGNRGLKICRGLSLYLPKDKSGYAALRVFTGVDVIQRYKVLQIIYI